MILRLTESDLRNLISSTIKKIIKEENENNSILSLIVSRLSNVTINAENGANETEVPLDEEGNSIAFIDFEVKDRRYLTPGVKSSSYDVPDDPDNIEGDFELYVTKIIIYDENDQEYEIEDNGMVTNALKDLVNLDDSDLDYPYEDDQSDWNDSWK